MSIHRAGAIALATTVLFVASCQKDQQETQKFSRADQELFRRDMSDMMFFTLANGVSLCVQEERTDGRVAVEVLYRAGFASETKGNPQISHLTEHAAIHCGSGSFGPGASLQAIQKDGGMLNAEAVADFVHIDYIVDGPRLEEVFQIESERLRAIHCDRPTLDREGGRVVHEIDATLKDPKGDLTKFAMMAFNQSLRFNARHVPVRDRVAKYTPEDVERFHHTYYRPDDMVIVVIGNVKTADAEALARKYFESIERRPSAALAKPVLSKSVAATWDVDAEVVFLFAPGPYSSDRERLILTMFGAFLKQTMANEQAVYGACRKTYCSNQIYPVGNLPFFIFAEPDDTYSNSEATTLLLDHLDATVALLDDARVEAIKGIIMSFVTATMLKPDVADYPLAHHQVIGQEALNVGMKHYLREGRSVEEFIAEVNSVTADELRTTVKKRLARGNLAQVTYGPRT
jgi:predicted Zn-dependent peptidase